MRRFTRLIFLPAILSLVSCGYYLQGTKNPLKDFGVEKIYVESFQNTTYRAGIEQLFTTAMIHEIETGRAFRIVNSRQEADAVLTGLVTTAETSVLNTTGISNVGTTSRTVGIEFAAQVTCRVVLKELNNKVIFSQDIPGSKNFTGSQLYSDVGATAALEDDSQQRIAYEFLATQMMSSAYQRMIDLF